MGSCSSSGGFAAVLGIAPVVAEYSRPAVDVPEVHVHLRKEGDLPLGIKVNVLQQLGLLQVIEVQEGGLVDKWNSEHDTEDQVFEGDWLYSVNGIKHSPDTMLLQMKSSSTLDLIVTRQRPVLPVCLGGRCSSSKDQAALRRVSRRFPVTLVTSPDLRLGLEIIVKGNIITVAAIREGAVQKWNRDHSSDEVRIGDRIVFVDAARGADMVTRLQTFGEHHLVVWRGPEGHNPEVLLERQFQELPLEIIDEDHVSDDVCGICLEDRVAGDILVRLPCGHRFHKHCGGVWLTTRRGLCPLCEWAADCPWPTRLPPPCACTNAPNVADDVGEHEGVANRILEAVRPRLLLPLKVAL